MFNAKELDEESGMYYYEARYYAPPTFISRDPLFEKYPFMSPYAYCANNPVKYIDPDGNDWYERENGQITWTDHTNKKDFENSGIKGTYLGKTYEADGKYYSLFGQTMSANSRIGKITKKIDNAFINYANYLIDNNNRKPYDPTNPGEWQNEPIQTVTDFSGVIPFKESFWSTSQNIYAPGDMGGKYAGVADIYFNVSKQKMKGKFNGFSIDYRIGGKYGGTRTSGCFITINPSPRSGDDYLYILALGFKDAASVKSLENRFFKLFPNAKSKKQ
jgi:RHS repeat-associated protein